MNIKAIASALPDWTIDSQTISEWSGLEPAKLEGKIGVYHRRFLQTGETGTDLSAKAVARLAADHSEFDPARIGLLIVVTQRLCSH